MACKNNKMKRFPSTRVLVLVAFTYAMASAAIGAAPEQRAGWIPAQTFIMGDQTGAGWPDQKPAHPVTLSSYYIASHLVTVQEYCDFLNSSSWDIEDGTFIVRKEGGEVLVNYPYSPVTKDGGKYIPKAHADRQPMYYVTWEGAALYCNYLSENVYPWGNTISSMNANYANQLGYITNVGSYKPNDYGLYDMAGNVMQWCHDWYKFEYYADCSSGIVDPSGPPEDQLTGHGVRALRGGAYYQPSSFQTVAYRYGTADTKGCFSYNGFRVAKSSSRMKAEAEAIERTEGSSNELIKASNWLDHAFLQTTRHYNSQAAFPFSFKLGGIPSSKLLKTWKMHVTESAIQDGKTRRIIRANDPKTGLEISCEIVTYEKFPVVEWVLQISNGGTSDTAIIEDLQALDYLFNRPLDEKREFIVRHSRGSRAAASDFFPKDELLGPRMKLTLGGHGGRPSDYSLPFMNLSWGNGGAVMAVGWSGQWLSSFERDQDRSLRVRTGLEQFRARLHPGESIRTPRMLLLFWNGEDKLRGHNLFRQFMLAHGIPRIDGKPVVPPIAASFAGLNDYTEQNQRVVAPKYGERGIEVQWIDAGWFVGGWPNGAGTWEPKPETFPNGLGPVGEAVHAAGMKFLLWFEIERVSRGSKIAREHPEWVIGPITEYGGVFNWGIPQAREWMTEKVSEQLQKGKVDIFRMDFNMEPLMYWQRNDSPDRQGMTEMRFVEGMYQLWDDLRARHPGLWIDNCASGGRMFDLETATRSISLTQSDGPYEPDRTSSTAVIGQLQNDGLNLYLPFHAGANFGIEPSYEFRSGMTSGNVLAVGVDAEPVAKIRKTVETYQRFRFHLQINRPREWRNQKD